MFSFNKKFFFIIIIVLILLYAFFRISSVDKVFNDNDDASEKESIEKLVDSFGSNLKNVSLLAPRENLINSIEENYSEFVSDELLQQWKNDPRSAPGRVSSSPWPERIEITDFEKLSDEEYNVTGRVVELTSQEVAHGGIAAVRPVKISVKKIGDKWLINSITVGKYEEFTE